MTNNPFNEIEDLLNRIDRFKAVIHTHKSQPQPDRLIIEGYQRLRQQFAHELSNLMRTSYELNVSIAA